MMSNNIETASKIVTSNSAVVVGGQVPAGMKRWVTFLMLDSAGPGAVSDVVLYAASVGISNPSFASVVATSNRRMVVPIRGTQLSQSDKLRPVLIPANGPNPNAPLFTIAGGKWLGMAASVTTGNVFVQYYDE